MNPQAAENAAPSPAAPAAPAAFILSTGSEIAAGLYPDTNAMELSRLLVQAGFAIVGHAAAPDDEAGILAQLRFASTRADLVVLTGGLGPTEDDRTREAVARFLNVALRPSRRAEAMMRERFAALGRPMPERNVRQANVPVGCSILPNFWGTAPGFVSPRATDRPMVVVMPGVPSEWRPMFERALNRRILPAFPDRPARRFQMLHLAMIPESEVNERLEPLFNHDPRLEVGLLAQSGIIRVELTVNTTVAGEAEALLADAVARAKTLLPAANLFAETPRFASLEEVVVALYRERGLKIALAESCTGGGIARRLTDVAGASDVLAEGLVVYSNAAKIARLGVREETLDRFGAVSAECAEELARGLAAQSGAEVALSVTGIAGPGGGTAEKPVGLVFFGLCDSRGHCASVRRTFGKGRARVRGLAELQGLDLLRRWACGVPFD